MSASQLVYSGDGGWFWQAPHGANISASSKRSRNNRKRRKRLRAEVLERDGDVCTYCPDLAATVDHIIPLAKGGEDTIENMTPVCEPCNQALGWLGL